MVRRLIFVLAALALVLAACGPAPTPEIIERTVEVPVEQTVEVPVEQTVEVPVEQTVEVPVTVEVPKDKTVIALAYNVYFTRSFAEGWPSPFDAVKTAVEAKHPDIEVTMNVMPDTVGAIHDTMVTWLTAQDGTVDILGIDSPWVAEFGKAGWLMPLNDRLTPQMLEELSEDYLNAYSYEGNYLAVPIWGSIGGFYYRKDLLDEYGFDPPETYDDVTEIAQTIVADNPDMVGFVWQGMKDEALVCNFSEFFLGFGGQYFDDDGNCTMNSPEGVAALEYMANLIDTGVSPQEVTNWKEAECEDQFASGRALFSRTWSSTAHWLDDAERSQVGGKWGLISNPAQPEGSHANVTGGWAFGINPNTDSPEEAWKVLEVIGSFEVQKAIAMAWGPLQPHKGLATDPEVIAGNPELTLVAELFEAAAPRVAAPGANYFQGSDIVQDEVHAAITGIKSAQAALDDACSRLDALQQ